MSRQGKASTPDRRRPADGPPRAERTLATNRQARFLYELLEHWTAGIVLTGSEVKSLRAARVNLADAYVAVDGTEAWLLNCHVAPYENAGYAGHEPMRRRKLLLHRREIDRMGHAVQAKGLTIVPLRIFFSGPHVKVELALARGKKLHDKRESIKRREEDRAARRRPDA